MTDSILTYEKKMWQLTDATKTEMPELAEAFYGAVKDAAYRDGFIDHKTKRLMALAVAIQAGCKDCMISQTSRALELGATTAEIFETCSVAISMGGTLAWSKALVVADYLREKGLIDPALTSESSVAQYLGSTAGQDIINDTPEIWGEKFSTRSDTVEREYDKFAETGAYDESFAEWNYVGPQTAAAIVRNYVPLSSTIMDAACGSGLTGTALRDLGYTDIHGMDISRSLLKLAEKTGAYSSLRKVDMQEFPLPIEDGTYDSVNFIGALTYFETNEILKEFCRIVRPGGYIVFSQRDDIMRNRNYGEQLRELEEMGLWKRMFATEPMPYLPKHPEYGTKINVQYFVYEVL